MSHGVSIMDLKYQQEKSWDVEPVFGHLQNDRHGRNGEMWKKKEFRNFDWNHYKRTKFRSKYVYLWMKK